MTARILIPCGTDERPRRHRWQWRTHYPITSEYPVWDRWCERCGRWYVDVIEHRAGSETPPDGSGPETEDDA